MFTSLTSWDLSNYALFSMLFDARPLSGYTSTTVVQMSLAAEPIFTGWRWHGTRSGMPFDGRMEKTEECLEGV
jgi:hypothetical protein